mmetsp:Transcript_5057/g.5249  ORF Transcript_5057/g.5249 Transcript_5057/m.5249 type:complete len:90 (+) Transcript_5057:188-457(+)
MITDAAAVGIGAVFGALTRYQIGKTAGAKIASDPQKYSHLSGWHTTGAPLDQPTVSQRAPRIRVMFATNVRNRRFPTKEPRTMKFDWGD